MTSASSPRAASTAERRRWRRPVAVAAVAAVLVGALGVRASVDDEPAVLVSRTRPLDVTAPVPTYAMATRDGLVVRFGEAELLLRGVDESRWLPSGDLVAFRNRGARSLELIDAATGEVLRRVRGVRGDLPGRSASRVNLLERYDQPSQVYAYTAELEPLGPERLPMTDDPAARTDPDIRRNYYGVAATVGDATFVLWHDGSESYEDGDHGVARIRDGQVDELLLNERLVALFLSVDGASVLALRQDRGEPCGGCVVSQSVVEVDPVDGELHGYGHPDEYEKDWRVDAIDKVGDRVAVRYVRAGDGSVPRERNLVGTYVYADRKWSLLPGSDVVTTWWQDGGRVLARPVREPRWTGDGFRLSWVADGSDVEKPIDGELGAYFGRRGRRSGGVAGRLLPG